jgi:hypothetical protein
MYSRVVTAWGTTLVDGDEVAVIDYEDKPRGEAEGPIPPNQLVPWLRLQVRHTTGRATTIGNHEGVKRHTRSGIFTIQVFVPFGGSLTEAEERAILVAHALEDKTKDRSVMLRNVRINEIGSDGHWYQTNVLADFEYDEVR